MQLSDMKNREIKYTQRPIKERFWEKVDKKGDEDCWEWQGARHTLKQKYGEIWHNGKMKGAHRIAWLLTHGEISNGLYVCHHCDNGLCVNPTHLFLGTQKDNMLDASKKGRIARGERAAGSKSNASDVMEIRLAYHLGLANQRELGLRYGLARTTISAIVINRSWKHLPIRLEDLLRWR